MNLGQIIGELGPILERAQSCEQLIAEACVVPETRSSGKSHTVAFRFAANRRVRQALTTFADNSRHGSECREDLQRRPGPEEAPPARDPHPGPGLAAGDVGLLARRHLLRPVHPPSQQRDQHVHRGAFDGIGVDSGD
ncbi:hypothetical protein ABIA33_001354 [Streptacidiphilus sp. MAP12-16]|uniref:transposase n=1 Tax=Streptacidiphilus sp. MAP12-16 TaxID=3156300 RepID=UPI0035153817